MWVKCTQCYSWSLLTYDGLKSLWIKQRHNLLWVKYGCSYTVAVSMHRMWSGNRGVRAASINKDSRTPPKNKQTNVNKPENLEVVTAYAKWIESQD